jgi:hypothetical protein
MNHNEKEALFLIASPLQLLCAIEAIHAFKIKKYDLVLKDSIKNNHNQMFTLLDEFEIKNFISVKKKFFGTFLPFVLLFYKLKSVSFKYCFMGENSTAFRSLCFSLNPKEIFLLDDGTASFWQRANIEFPSNKYAWQTHYGKLRAYRYPIVGMTLKQTKRISYFSMILEDAINSEIIIKHKLEHTTRFINQKKINQPKKYDLSTALFLDVAKLLRHGHLTFQDYEWAYEKFLLLCDQSISKIYFRPHRAYKNTECEIKRIKSLMFCIQDNHLPLEIELATNGSPHIIGGFVSTGLITSKKMFPNTRVYAIDMRERLKANCADPMLINTLTQNYIEFLKVGIEII